MPRAKNQQNHRNFSIRLNPRRLGHTIANRRPGDGKSFEGPGGWAPEKDYPSFFDNGRQFVAQAVAEHKYLDSKRLDVYRTVPTVSTRSGGSKTVPARRECLSGPSRCLPVEKPQRCRARESVHRE